MQLQIDLARVNEKYKERVHSLTEENLLLQAGVDHLQEQLAEAERCLAELRAELTQMMIQDARDSTDGDTD